MPKIIGEKLIDLVAECSILFDLINRIVDHFRVPIWCAEKRITNSDAKGLSELRADSSNSIPIWCATALRVNLTPRYPLELEGNPTKISRNSELHEYFL